MLRLLNRFRNDLAVAALPQELESSAARTVTFLESEAARVSINSVETRAGGLQAEISVRNLGGALAQVVGYLASSCLMGCRLSSFLGAIFQCHRYFRFSGGYARLGDSIAPCAIDSAKKPRDPEFALLVE